MSAENLDRDAITARLISPESPFREKFDTRVEFDPLLAENLHLYDWNVTPILRRFTLSGDTTTTGMLVCTRSDYPASPVTQFRFAASDLAVRFDDPTDFDWQASGYYPISDITKFRQIWVAYKHLLPSLATDVAASIETDLRLRLDVQEWPADALMPNPDSFRRAVNFLSIHREFGPPRIVFTLAGNTELSWRKARDKLISLEFLPTGLVSWLVFAPSTDPAQAKESSGGETAASEVLDRVVVYGATEWMSRDSGSNS